MRNNHHSESAELDLYLKVQNCALQVLRDIAPFIRTGVTEYDIVKEAIRLLALEGIEDCWYHNIPAFVLAGERSTLSISGKDYIPSDVLVRENDVITIDLSPRLNEYWGDCARSYIVGHSSDMELMEGIKFEKKLHEFMLSIVTPDMTMQELHADVNNYIQELGFENLDFLGNLGHSIEKHIDRRLYIEAGNHTRLGDVALFTFEPHIRKKDGKWGFKRENIHYFTNGKLTPLGDAELLGAL